MRRPSANGPAPDLKSAALTATCDLSAAQVKDKTGAPLIILSAPRSGSTALFEFMTGLPPFWNIRGESHGVFRAFPELRLENEQADSMALSAAHAPSALADQFRRCFLALAVDHADMPYLSQPPDSRPARITLLEKTPRNALNIDFLLEIFPESRFLFLHRPPGPAISSLMEGWVAGLRTGRFVSFKGLPGWHLPAWCFLLPRGWRKLIGQPIPEICAFQWQAANQAIMDGLAPLPKDRWAALGYDDFISNPSAAIAKACEHLGIPVKLPNTTAPLPLSRTTLSRPAPDKWLANKPHMAAFLTEMERFYETVLAASGG